MPKKIEISHKTIVFTALFLIALWFLYFIREIILILFMALLITIILEPFVRKLSRIKIPRVVSVIICYLIFIVVVGGVIAGVVPPLVDQTSSFITNLPQYLANLGVSQSLTDQALGQLILSAGALPGQVVKVGVSIVSNFITIISVLIFAFYFLLARNKIEKQFVNFFGEKTSDQILNILKLSETKLGGWAIGQLTLMITVGILTYIGLIILGIPYSLPLALLAGILELVPTLGPILSAIPSVIIGLSISPLLGLAVVALFFLVQQFENYLLVPKIMQKSVGLNPLVILIALAIGFRVAGIIGAFIAIPVFMELQILFKELVLPRLND